MDLAETVGLVVGVAEQLRNCGVLVIRMLVCIFWIVFTLI